MASRRTVILLWVLLAVVVATGIASGAVWWLWWRTPAPHLTEGAWPALVTTIAGSGAPESREGAWDVAAFSDPFAVAVAPDGRIFVADAGENNRVRRIDTTGTVVTLAGGAGEGWHDGRRGAAAFHTPSGLALDTEGSLFVADTGTHRIRRIGPDGRVTTVGGNGQPGYLDGPALDAQFDGPMGLALAPNGILYIADAYNNRVRALDRGGHVRTVAGDGLAGFADGPAAIARFDVPCGVAVESDGTLLVADTGNNAIRRIGPDGSVTTISLIVAVDPQQDISLFRPVGIAAGRDHNFFVTDRRGRILHVLADRRARLLAGSLSGYADGPGTTARFNNPTGVAVDREGALVVADAGNRLVRRIVPPGLYPPDPPRSPLAGPPGPRVDALRRLTLAWPLDPQFSWHEIAGTMGEARGNLSDTRERFHAGIDVHAGEGTVVRAVRSAKVDSPIAALGFGSLIESVNVGAFTYVHLRVGRDRRDRPMTLANEVTATITATPGVANGVHAADFAFVGDQIGVPMVVRLRRGTRVLLGDALGTVNRFAHVHLNAGSPGREVNPLSLPFAGFIDTVPPTIEPRGIRFYDETWMPFEAHGKKPANVAHGRVRIVVDAFDQVTGNENRRRLGVYQLGYQILRPDRSPVPGFERPLYTMVFDRLPQEAHSAQRVYAEGSGISVYGSRRTRFRYIVTNRMGDGEVTEDFWDTQALPPGPYIVRVTVADASGNETKADARVVIVP
jgi:DNA-binding beta-propeller fold protein YncE